MGGVYGVGINDADYQVQVKAELPKIGGKRKQIVLWTCPYYNRWKHMMARGHSERVKRLYPHYKDVSVCVHWHTFTNFRSWCVEQEGTYGISLENDNLHLDKDIISPSNRIYTPEACAFVSPSVNSLLTDRKVDRGDLPLGVSFHKQHQKYYSSCNNGKGRHKFLGLFHDPMQAHHAWQIFKSQVIENVIEEQTHPKVIEALTMRVERLRYEAANGLETIKL